METIIDEPKMIGMYMARIAEPVEDEVHVITANGSRLNVSQLMHLLAYELNVIRCRILGMALLI